MANLATWYLPVSRMTFSFMNPNNYSCTARILYGVMYCLLKSICCNLKNQRSEVSSMCVGIKMQNKPYMLWGEGLIRGLMIVVDGIS
jgi:hypothetical protein